MDVRLKSPFRLSATYFDGAKVGKFRSSVSGPTSSGSFALSLIRGSPHRAIHGPVRLAWRPARLPPDQRQDSAVTYVALCVVKCHCDKKALLYSGAERPERHANAEHRHDSQEQRALVGATRPGALVSAVGQQPAGDALDVARFGNGRVYRMVRALAAALEQLDVAVQMAGAGQEDVLQVVFRQVHRARRADQNAVLAEQAHGLLVQATVGAFAVFHVFLAFDECRRVGDDYVETLFCGFQFLERFENIAFDAGHLFGKTVQGCVALHAIEGEGRRVDAGDVAGTESRCLNAPAADVAVQVQHTLAFDIRGDARAVHAVVIEPAGFLPGHDRCFELHAVLFQRNPFRHQTENGFDVTIQAFRIASRRIVLEQNAAWLDDLNQRRNDVFLVVFHRGRGQLNDQNVTKTIDYQTRQQVGVAVGQTVERLVEQAFTQRQRNVEAMDEQRLVERQLDVAGQQACADQVVGAHGDDAQRLAARSFEDGLITGCKTMQWSGGYIDLVAVDPQMTGAQAAVGVGFEAQARQGHDVAPEKRAGL
ncbi:hypothetical protein ALP63_04830 [Pseudomonas syringae pv. aceris]|nr:hypothetical protein ALP63_04830 [Pseudomonas syringae pv. aceris]